jgi:hypothetical protein
LHGKIIGSIRRFLKNLINLTGIKSYRSPEKLTFAGLMARSPVVFMTGEVTFCFGGFMKFTLSIWILFFGFAVFAGNAKNAAHTAKRSVASKNFCWKETGDPQYPSAVEGACCLHNGGKINDNSEGHPPIAICDGGKYDGFYIGSEK